MRPCCCEPFRDGSFEAMVRPGARLKPGQEAVVVDPGGGRGAGPARGGRHRWTRGSGGCECCRRGGLWTGTRWTASAACPCLPTSAHPAEEADEERYQTVFRAEQGEAVAAPTAGLHFTDELILALKSRGCLWHPVRLHVGLGTFRPMTAEHLDGHVMHEERYEIPEETAAVLEDVLRKRTRPLLCHRHHQPEDPRGRLGWHGSSALGSHAAVHPTRLPAAHGRSSAHQLPPAREHLVRAGLDPAGPGPCQGCLRRSRPSSATGSSPTAMPC